MEQKNSDDYQADASAPALSEKVIGVSERVRELVAQTLAGYAGDAFSSLNIIFSENSAPWPSSYSAREQQSFRMLADCVLETIVGAELNFSKAAERADVSLKSDTSLKDSEA